MRNGSGDEIFALFNEAGCFVKGFSHEHWFKELRHTDLDKDVPATLASGVSESAFSPEDVTFCLWANREDKSWHQATVDWPGSEDLLRWLQTDGPNGSGSLLYIFDGQPKTYREFASDYFEKKIPVASIREIYAHSDLSDEIVRSLNSAMQLSDLREDLRIIGYPAREQL